VNITVIPRGADLIETTARRIEESGFEPSDALVVFPGKRPSHHLRRRLSRSQNRGFIPPRIFSMDELVHHVFDTWTAGSSPLMEDIDAVAILHEIQLASPRPIGGSAFMSLDGFFPLGLSIFQDLEELLIEGVPPEKAAEMQPLIQAEVPPASRERLAELARFYRDFYPAAEKRGLSTRSSRYGKVADSISEKDLNRCRTAIFAGFYSMSGVERALFRRLGSLPPVSFIFQDGPGLDAKLESLGVKQPVVEKGAIGNGPKASFTSSPDTHGQVFALGAALENVDEGTAIVLPRAETLFPLLRHCLSRFDEESYNISLGYPLDRTPLYGFFADLMELVGSMDGDRVYLPDYLTFVLHPYTKNIRFRGSAETTRVLFHSIEERLSAARTKTFTTLEEIESDPKLLESVPGRSGEADSATATELALHLKQIHDRTVRRFRSFSTVGEFARACMELISWVHESSTARGHPYFSRFAEEFMRSLDLISRSLLGEKSFSDTAGYFILFKRVLRTRHHPFPGTPLRGLQVLGSLETRGLRFDRVFVLDANEGALPSSSGDDSLLPFSVRVSLGLPTYRNRDEAAAYHFELLSEGARELHLFSVESGEKERSRFVERLLWNRQKTEGAAGETDLVRPIQYRVNLENKTPEPARKTPEMVEWLRQRKYSATSLDTYLRCPLAFYHAYVLNLGMREQASGEIEPADVGLFVHAVLFRYFSPRTGRILTEADADPRAMEAIVDALFKERWGDADTGAARLLHGQIKSHLLDFIRIYLRDLVTGMRVEINGLERRAEVVWNGFSLTGRLDAAVKRNGDELVIDYKTSANPYWYRIRFDRLDPGDRETWGSAIPTLQLPIYLMLEPRAHNAMFLLLGRSVLDRSIELPLYADAAEAAREKPRLEAVIMGLLAEIASPGVPFESAKDKKRACPTCDFSTLCGTQWLA
jgi:ATP-dependent helicase/nuclease subunit B